MPLLRRRSGVFAIATVMIMGAILLGLAFILDFQSRTTYVAAVKASRGHGVVRDIETVFHHVLWKLQEDFQGVDPEKSLNQRQSQVWGLGVDGGLEWREQVRWSEIFEDQPWKPGPEPAPVDLVIRLDVNDGDPSTWPSFQTTATPPGGAPAAVEPEDPDEPADPPSLAGFGGTGVTATPKKPGATGAPSQVFEKKEGEGELSTEALGLLTMKATISRGEGRHEVTRTLEEARPVMFLAERPWVQEGQIWTNRAKHLHLFVAPFYLGARVYSDDDTANGQDETEPLVESDEGEAPRTPPQEGAE